MYRGAAPCDSLIRDVALRGSWSGIFSHITTPNRRILLELVCAADILL
jgi:hypothetical protein